MGDAIGGAAARDAVQPALTDAGLELDARTAGADAADGAGAMDAGRGQMPDAGTRVPDMGRVDPVDMAVEDPRDAAVDAAVDFPCNDVRFGGERLDVRGFEYRIERAQREESGCVEGVDTRLLDLAGLDEGPVTFTWTGRVRRTGSPVSLTMRIELSELCEVHIIWQGTQFGGVEFIAAGVLMEDSVITVRNHCLMAMSTPV